MRINDWSSDVCSSDLVPSHDHPHHLVRPFEDRMDAQVAPETLDRIILQIAVAAEQLQRVVDDLAAVIGREPLRHRREARLVGGVRGYLRGSEIEQRARAFETTTERRVGTECVSTCR